MKYYNTLVFNKATQETEIVIGRRFTEEEKKQYAEWYQDYGFVGCGDHIELYEIKANDLPKRRPDGEYQGCSNDAWILTDGEIEYYTNLHKERTVGETKKEQEEKIETLTNIIETAQNQTDMPTEKELEKRIREYRNTNYEGGYGYIPYIVSQETYERAVTELQQLSKQ